MIPIFNLSRTHAPLKKAFAKTFKDVLEGNNFVLGENVKAFEKEFSSYIGTEYAVGVGSGTEALSLALQAVGVKAGDKVIMPANSYPTVFAVTAIGAVPRPVDVTPNTYLINPKEIEKVLKKEKIKAVIVVHMYGQSADIKTIVAITKKYKVPLIEDCAHAHGAPVGTYGDASCYSFYPTKNLGALGDGGMVCTNNKEIYEKVKLLRMYGEKERYVSVELGRNSRLDELQAALLRVKLKHLDSWNKKRQQIAKWYSVEFQRIHSTEYRIHRKNSEFCILNTEFSSNCVYHLYVIRVKKREELIECLKNQGISTGIHYPTPVHLIPSMKFLGYKEGDFPESERLSSKVLSLPMWPGLTQKEVEFVCTTIEEFNNSTISQ